jgi:hypothetical protein
MFIGHTHNELDACFGVISNMSRPATFAHPDDLKEMLPGLIEKFDKPCEVTDVDFEGDPDIPDYRRYVVFLFSVYIRVTVSLILGLRMLLPHIKKDALHSVKHIHLFVFRMIDGKV